MTFDPFGVPRVLHLWQQEGTSLAQCRAALQEQMCYYGFGASFMHVRLVRFNDQKLPRSQAPILFVSQPTAMATMQCDWTGM